MNQFIIFLVGSIGALAPEIVRLYSIRHAPEKFFWSWFYLCASTVFALLGGLVALVLPATTYWGALYVGISTPVLINTALKKGLDTPQISLKSAPQIARQQISLIRSFLKGL